MYHKPIVKDLVQIAALITTLLGCKEVPLLFIHFIHEETGAWRVYVPTAHSWEVAAPTRRHYAFLPPQWSI